MEETEMTNKTTIFIIWLVFFAFVSVPSFLAYADDDHREKRWYHKILDWDDHDDDNKGKHRKRKRDRHRNGDHRNKYIKPVNNSVYKEECGACHFAYQPELLPGASWMNILTNSGEHFGESIELDDDSKKVISYYLKSNSAEYSSAKRAVKIMRSLRNRVPNRITDIPYIIEKHHEINPEVLNRKSIGSLSNCIACHKTAEEGIYEDDNVKIPK
jgi:hypothetical protein